MATVITSIRGLQNLGNLENFEANFNSLQTVNLSGLTNLTIVDIGDNRTIDDSNKSLTSVNLSGCTALQYLYLDDSDFSAGIPNLTGRVNLETLDMDQCSITGSIDLSMLSSLTTLDLFGNTDLTSVTLPISNFDEVRITNAALTETSVNNILLALDASGSTNGTVELQGGTSAPPSSGAIILATLQSLFDKSWEVIANSTFTEYTLYNGTNLATACSSVNLQIAYSPSNNLIVGDFLYFDNLGMQPYTYTFSKDVSGTVYETNGSSGEIISISTCP